MSNWTVR